MFRNKLIIILLSYVFSSLLYAEEEFQITLDKLRDNKDLMSIIHGFIPEADNDDEFIEKDFGKGPAGKYRFLIEEMNISFEYDGYQKINKNSKPHYKLNNIRITAKFDPSEIKYSGDLYVNNIFSKNKDKYESQGNINKAYYQELRRKQTILHENHHKSLIRIMPFMTKFPSKSPKFYAIIEGLADKAAVQHYKWLLLEGKLEKIRIFSDKAVVMENIEKAVRATFPNKKFNSQTHILEQFIVGSAKISNIDYTYQEGYNLAQRIHSPSQLVDLYEEHLRTISKEFTSIIDNMGVSQLPMTGKGTGILHYKNNKYTITLNEFPSDLVALIAEGSDIIKGYSPTGLDPKATTRLLEISKIILTLSKDPANQFNQLPKEKRMRITELLMSCEAKTRQARSNAAMTASNDAKAIMEFEAAIKSLNPSMSIEGHLRSLFAR